MVDSAQEIIKKAQLWDALMSSGRIRLLGYVGLGKRQDKTIPRYAHMGLEFWTEISDFGDTPEHRKANAEVVALIQEFAEKMITNGQKDTAGN